MADMRALLAGLGLADGDIVQESFGTSSAAARRTATEAPASGTVPRVRFARSGVEVDWDDRFANLLDFAEAQGLTPDFSCRAGVCGTCACRRLSGGTNYAEDPLDPPQGDGIFLCCSIPTGPVTLDI